MRLIMSASFHLPSSWLIVPPSVVNRYINPYWNMVCINKIFTLNRRKWYSVLSHWSLGFPYLLECISNQFLPVLRKIPWQPTDLGFRWVVVFPEPIVKPFFHPLYKILIIISIIKCRNDHCEHLKQYSPHQLFLFYWGSYKYLYTSFFISYLSW